MPAVLQNSNLVAVIGPVGAGKVRTHKLAYILHMNSRHMWTSRTNVAMMIPEAFPFM